ncbi:CaiB/BaiF CoA transferase family protein [Frankia sp. Cas4]|uniref:CaiB/BaiF CoA transferase family protein n=1 Tax=Frankia sp. Cas4 TaxID=3073927 RepID=UPI002AD279FA|nr:CoA transferase [Frankia sp. Cas4]
MSQPGLLDGVRVLESAMLFNGDRLGCLLGDLGADVIKVEAPPVGDYLRDFLGQVVPHHSPAHLEVNKHKRSVVLDLRAQDGLETFWRLLDTADVFVDGNAGDALDRLGIGYAQQQARRPGIVYCQYSGFGARGPYASIPTHGQMMNALAGGYPHELGEDGFVRPSTAVPFMGGISGDDGTATGAIYAAYAIAAALVRHGRTGEGAYLDVAASDAVVANSWVGATYGLNNDRITDRRSLPASDETGASAKYQFYACADGKVLLFCAIEPKFWRNFCRAIGRDDLIGGGNGQPVDFAGGQDDLRRSLAEIFRSRSLAEWVAIAVEHDIALGPAYGDATDLLTDPHVQARGLLVETTHPVAGAYTNIGFPALIAGIDYRVQRGAPRLGEHNAEILAELDEA